MRHFCTYFDSNYLVRGLALHASLTEHCPRFTLWILCFDEQAEVELRTLRLANIELIRPDALENKILGLAEARKSRSKIEFYFTCTPALPLFLFKTRPEIDLITYLDSDLYFYSSPEPIFAELGLGSIALIEHRVSGRLKFVNDWGIYNVGWVSFRRDKSGLACLTWWSERCIEWCYHRLEDGKYADQKYLDYFPKNFTNVVVIGHKGANLAPWNISNYRIRKETGRLIVDNSPLIFFHFQGFRQINRFCYASGFYSVAIPRRVLRLVFNPYIRMIRQLDPERRFYKKRHYQLNPISKVSLPKRGFRWAKALPGALKETFFGGRMLYMLNHVV